MKWVTRARPKTDRIACPWLIRRFIDPDAEILYVPKEDVLAVADARRRPQLRRPRRALRPPRRQVHLRGPHRRLRPRRRPSARPPREDRPRRRHRGELAHGPRRARPARHRARRARRRSATTTGSSTGPASSTTPSTPGAPSRPPPRRHDRAPRLRRTAGRHRPPGRQADGRGGDHRAEVGRAVVPEGLAGLHGDGHRRGARRSGAAGRVDAGARRGAARADLVPRCRGRRGDRRGVVRRSAWVVSAELRLRCVRLRDLRGVPQRDEGAAQTELEFAGPQCNLRDIDLGIAVGSAAKTAALHSVDCRCQTSASPSPPAS